MGGFDDGAVLEIGWDFLQRQAAVVVLRVDETGEILGANGYARELTGLALDSGSLGDLLIVSNAAAELRRWLTPSPEPRLMNVRTADGLPQTLYVTSVRAGSGLLLFGQADHREQERLRREFLELNRELTALGRELAQANAELVRLNLLKNKFLGMASHDLRKPAGLILNQAEMLLEDPALAGSPDARRMLSGIVASAGSMARMIDDFLDVAMIEAGRLALDLQVVAQDDLFASALALVQGAAAKRGIKVRNALDEASARLRVDGPKLEQVLTNLISNAIEYSPDGACVTVASRPEGDGLRFWVEDQGPGVDPEKQRGLFEAFSGGGKLKRNGERSIGLGLVIVCNIVEAHGGNCFVESRQGIGSRFGFLLPASCLAAR